VRRFFKLIDADPSPNRWHLKPVQDDQGRKISSWQFVEGKVLDLGFVPRFYLERPGHPLDFCWASCGTPVVNTRFVRVLEQLGAHREVQLIPAWVEGQSEPHFILNALSIIRCIDDARCAEVLYWKPEDQRPDKLGQYRSVYGLKVDPVRVGAAHLFRTWGWLVVMVLSQELKDALERAGLTGMTFTEV
jgi:hypothetical protein